MEIETMDKAWKDINSLVMVATKLVMTLERDGKAGTVVYMKAVTLRDKLRECRNTLAQSVWFNGGE